MIPEEASSENKLADKNFVGTKVATKLDKFVQIEVPYTYKMVVPVDRDKPYLFRIIATRQDGTVNNELVYIYIKRDSSYYTVISKAFRDWVDINPENIKVYQDGSWPLANFYVSFEPSLSYSGNTTYHITDFDENEIAPSVLQNVPGDTLATIEITRLASSQYVDGVARELDSDISNIDGRVQFIEDVIPSSADPDTNQLADKAWVKAVNDLVNYYKKSETYTKSEVDQKIQTETATYKGLFDKWSDVPFDSASYPIDWGSFPPDNNDYIVIRDASLYATKWISGNADGYNVGDYVVEYNEIDNAYSGTYICIEYNAGSMDLPSEDSEHWQRVTENPNYKGTWRFKYAQSGEYAPFNFLPEYQINEEPLTTSQIAALDSGITAAKVTKLDELPTKNELQTELAGKQDTLVSGANIKTFAGQSLLSSGDVIQKVAIPAGNHLVMPNGSYVAVIKYGGVTMLFTPSTPGANILRLQGQPAVSTPDTDKATYDFGSQSFHFGTIGSSADTASVMFISGTAVAASTSNSSVSGYQNSPVVLQDKLVSGTNIKTINGTSLLGSDDIQISADTSDCVKFGETISALNHYLKIDGGGEPFSLMLIVALDDITSEYLVRGDNQRVTIVKMDGGQSFDGMLRIDKDTYSPIALYHEDSIVATPILLSGTMPTITDSASASGDNEEIPMFQTKKELPSGGTAGQVLTKASGTDYDVEWTNGGGGSSDVFWATYNSTTYADIVAAYNAGKVVVCSYDNTAYVLSRIDNNYAYFYGVNQTLLYFLRVRASDSAYYKTQYNAEVTSNKVSTLSGNETNTSKYPNTKAVADALGKIGVISHDIKYNVDGNVVISHTITNAVNGLIPQAFIDKWKAMGGTFTEGGYFAMNGIDDLSYEDALAVDAAGILTTWTANSFAYFLMSQSGLITSDSAAGVIYKKVAPRTMYPLQISGIPANSGSVYFFMRFSPLEVLKAEASINIRANTTNQYFCSNAKRLRRIENITFEIDLWTSQPTGLFNLVNIEYIQFTKLAYSMNLSSCPAFSAEAVAYMVANAGTADIIITLHATAYARAIADADVKAALANHPNVQLGQ